MTTKKMMMFAIAALVGCRSEAANVEPTKAETKAMTLEESIKRGKHLTLVSGCNDCHTPWKPTATGAEPDMTRELSGHPAEMQLPPPPEPQGPWIVASAATNTAYAGPWGITYTANLTPDNETGIGTWTKQNFIDTIRNGRHMGAGRPLLPPMPAAMYANYPDEDLGALYDYLRTLKPIKNAVPAPLPPKGAK